MQFPGPKYIWTLFIFQTYLPILPYRNYLLQYPHFFMIPDHVLHTSVFHIFILHLSFTFLFYSHDLVPNLNITNNLHLPLCHYHCSTPCTNILKLCFCFPLLFIFLLVLLYVCACTCVLLNSMWFSFVCLYTSKKGHHTICSFLRLAFLFNIMLICTSMLFLQL